MIELHMKGVIFESRAAYASPEDEARGADPQLVLVSFHDPESGIRAIVPFDAPAWQNFKRHVAADGKVSPIALARDLPRMDVPRGR